MGMRQLPQKHAKTFLCRKTLWFENSNKRASRSCIFLADIRRCGCLQCHKSTSLLWQDVLERWKCTVSVMVEAAELSLLCISTFADSRARASQEVVQAQSSSWEPLYTGCWHLPRRRHNAKKHRKKLEKREKNKYLMKSNRADLSSELLTLWRAWNGTLAWRTSTPLALMSKPHKPRIVIVTVSVCSFFSDMYECIVFIVYNTNITSKRANAKADASTLRIPVFFHLLTTHQAYLVHSSQCSHILRPITGSQAASQGSWCRSASRHSSCKGLKTSTSEFASKPFREACQAVKYLLVIWGGALLVSNFLMLLFYGLGRVKHRNLFWFCRHVAVQDVHRAAVGNLLVTSCPCPRFESWATASWEQLWGIVQGVLHARDTTWFLPFLQRLGFFVQNAILREQSNTATLAHIVHDWKILKVHSNKVDSTSLSQRCKLLLVVASSINVWVLSFLEDMSKCIIWYAALSSECALGGW